MNYKTKLMILIIIALSATIVSITGLGMMMYKCIGCHTNYDTEGMILFVIGIILAIALSLVARRWKKS